MKYFKEGYILAKENEIKINNLISEKYSAFNCETYYDAQGETEIHSPFTYNFPSFQVKSGEDVVVQVNFCIKSETSSDVNFKILVEDTIVLNETHLVNGEQNFSLMQKVTVSKNKSNSLKMIVTCDEDLSINNIKTFLWGTGIFFIDYSSEIEFFATRNGSRVIYYYLANNKLFYVEKMASDDTLYLSEMQYYCSVKSACFCFSKTVDGDNANKLFLFRVDNTKNLYISEFGSVETSLATGVSQVSASCLSSSFFEDMLVCIIKNGLPQYATISFENGEMICSKFNTINCKNESVKKIIAVAGERSKQFIIVQTVKNGYIFVNSDEIFEDYCISGLEVSSSVIVQARTLAQGDQELE